MKQVLIKAGDVVVTDVPAPSVGPRNVLVRTAFSCISAGTEANSVQMSGLPLYRRALKQPENVRRVLQMIREQGLAQTVARVRGKLEGGAATGYSASGTVISIGSEVAEFAIGDRVACAGAGYANHAEIIDVPVNLVVRVPNGVTLAQASTVTLGAIALQGVRRLNPTLGESFVVSGLGLLGQLAVQMLRANGCRVIGVDPDSRRRDLARESGAGVVLDPSDAGYAQDIVGITDGVGADGVLIAAAGASDEIVSSAFRACRRKGRVVIVGDVGLALRRSDFYAKEIDFLISASYGPGRYDPLYEEGGHDYPLGYVRWTENRNMSAYLHLLASGDISLESLEPTIFAVDDATTAYKALGGTARRSLISLLSYGTNDDAGKTTLPRPRRTRSVPGRIRVGIIGAGGFAQGVHLPNLARLREHYEVRAIVSRTGANARFVAERFDAAYSSTDPKAVLSDPDIDLVIVATRHDLHASLVIAALERGKHVFVEKPLAIREQELEQIERFYQNDAAEKPVLMTGFNRRFSPAVERVLRCLASRNSPLMISYRMNAGYLPMDHWVHGPEGGGRNIGEACHIYDLFAALTEASPVSAEAVAIEPSSRAWSRFDNFVATIRYADGSVCSLVYTALGNRSYPKERMDVFCDGMVLSLDDFKSLRVTGGRFAPWKSSVPRKGQFQELEALAESLKTGKWAISLQSQLETTRLSFEIDSLLRSGVRSEAHGASSADFGLPRHDATDSALASDGPP